MMEYKLVLGSGSPRRKELLTGLSYQFDIRTKDTDESFSQEMEPTEVPAHLATRKAEALFGILEENEIVLCADTVVILEGEILGKPENRDEAIEMLLKLSGRTHLVVTGVFIGNQRQSNIFSDSTEVTFGSLTKAEIEFYIDTCKPFDKAGSYGVQEWIGYVAVEKMNGSYTTVMGLPTHLVYRELKKWPLGNYHQSYD